jgi:hypothetical protein
MKMSPGLLIYVFPVVVILWALFGEPIRRFRQRRRDARVLQKMKSLDRPALAEEAVLVYLRGSGLPDEIYQTYDVGSLEDQLREAIDRCGVGEFDGNEFGPEETILYMYGPDAECLYAAVEPVLRAYPLCREGIAVIRGGPPGAPEREVSLA